MIKIQTISITDINPDRLQILHDAAEKYISILSQLTDEQNTSQQHIHLNLAHLWHLQITKKMLNRSATEKIKVEISTAFVVYDTLQNYQSYVSHPLEKSQLNDLIMQLFSKLPYTTDIKDVLSIESKLNINANV